MGGQNNSRETFFSVGEKRCVLGIFGSSVGVTAGLLAFLSSSV